jgi:hypothetical protein
MRHDIGDIVFTIQKLKNYENDPMVSGAFKNAALTEIGRLGAELGSLSVNELVDFIISFEGF